jgi:poly(A) polymerase Pap1
MNKFAEITQKKALKPVLKKENRFAGRPLAAETSGEQLNINFIINRLKRLKNHLNLPFIGKLPDIVNLMLNNCYRDKIQKIYLFGSYAYGKPDKDSDLDFLVIIDDDILSKRRDVSFQIMGQFWDSDIIPSDILVYNADMFYGYTNPRGIESTILKRGVVIYERR